MNLLTLELLDAHTNITSWLERQLIGEDLPAVVSEMLGWSVCSRDRSTLDAEFGDRLQLILKSGLTASDAQVLLKHPHLLLDLQEQICFHGGDYWQNLGTQNGTGRSSGTGDAIPPTLDGLLRFLDEQGPVQTDDTPIKKSPSAPQQKRKGRTWVTQLLALTLLVSLGGLVLQQGRFDAPVPGNSVAVDDWGFNSLKKISSKSTAPDYLEAVAAAMEDWKSKPPTDAQSGAKRLVDLIQGCKNLIADDQMDRSPLDLESRKWLRAKCEAWIVKFREDLAAIHNDPSSWSETAARMNAKIEKAAGTLRERAAMSSV